MINTYDNHDEFNQNNVQFNNSQNHSFLYKFYQLVTSTIYTAIGYLCLEIVFGITLHFIALHNTPQAVAIIGIAYSTVNMILIPIGLGTNQSLNVHSAQALGANKKQLAFTFFNLSLILHLLYSIPITIAIFALKPLIVMVMNDQDKDGEMLSIYFYFLIPSCIISILYEQIKAFLIAHKIFAIFMYIQIITTLLHILWCYLFIVVWNIGGGVQGAGIAIILTESLNLLFAFIVIWMSRYKEQVFNNYSFQFSISKQNKILYSYFINSLPIIIHSVAEYFIFYLFIYISIPFGAIKLNAQLGLANSSAIFFKVVIALSITLMTYIGNEMAAKRITQAKVYAVNGLLFYLIYFIIFAFAILTWEREWVNFYSAQNEEVSKVMLAVKYIFLFGLFGDGIQGTLTGVLLGIDRKEFTNYSNILVDYVIGIPLVIYFAYDLGGVGQNQEVYGIWIAYNITSYGLAVLFILISIISDWMKLSEFIHDRVEHQCEIDFLQEQYEQINTEEI